VLLAMAAPVVWMSWDLAVTGDPLHSLTSTRELASELGRPRGAGSAVELLPQYLMNVAGGAVAWMGVIGALACLWLAQKRSRPVVTVLGLGCLAFLVLGVAELPLIIRYAFLPAIVLCVCCGTLVALPRLARSRRGAAAACAAAAVVLLVLELPDQLRRGNHGRNAAVSRAAIQADLERLTLLSTVRDAVQACPRVWSTSHRPLPLLAIWLDLPVGRLRSGTPDRGDRGVVIDPATDRIAQEFRLLGADGRAARPSLPAGFVEVGRTASWRAYRRCGGNS